MEAFSTRKEDKTTGAVFSELNNYRKVPKKKIISHPRVVCAPSLLLFLGEFVPVIANKTRNGEGSNQENDFILDAFWSGVFRALSKSAD
jgi:hypothetical protein